MSKLKLQHGVSRIRRAKLQSSVDQTVADDIDLMASWSNNETQYVVNELLRFAIAQEEDFLKYKASVAANPARNTNGVTATPATTKPTAEPAAKSETPVSSRTAQE